MDRHLFGTYTMLQKEQRVKYSTSLEKMNIFRSEYEGHDIMKIKNWFGAR